MPDTHYYEKPVLLDRARHRHLKVKPSHSFHFARRANSLYLAGVEFPEAMKEYPIVFTRGANGKLSPVAMLGLRRQENLFVDDDGRWDAHYVPAFVRRYPFVLAQLGKEMGLCIDEGFKGFNDSEGEPLFDERGGNAPFLANAIDFLGKYQKEFARTEAFCLHLDEADVLREMDAKAELPDGRNFKVQGLLVVDEPKLMALPDAKALAMFRAGEMHLVSMHLASLSNIHRLVQRVARRADMKPAPQPGG